MPRKRAVSSEEASRQLLRLAARQHGVVATHQLRHLEVSWEQVRDRRHPGWLRRVHQGVYALAGQEKQTFTRWMAAVLACGPGAVISHLDAARLLGLLQLDAAAARSSVHVTIPAETNRRQRRGIALHRMELSDDETCVHREIPATAPSRTILDLAAAVDMRGLERLVDEGARLRICTEPDLHALLERHSGRRGAIRLRDVLSRHVPGSTLTRSELEERFLELCRGRGVPEPLVNAPVLGLTVDFLWPPGLVAELDGAATHLTRRAFQDDRDRDSPAGLERLPRPSLHLVRPPSSPRGGRTAHPARARRQRARLGPLEGPARFRLLVLEVGLDPGDAAVISESPDGPGADLHLDAAPRAPGARVLMHEYPPIPNLDLARLGDLRLERVRLHPGPEGVAPLQRRFGSRADEEDVRMHELRDGVVFPAVEGLVAALERLPDQLVRNLHDRQYRGEPWKQGR
jgi:hypothetical protein